MEKQYNLFNHEIQVHFEPKLVRVFSDAALWAFLKDDAGTRFEILVKIIKDDYLKKYEVELNITNDSLIVEILVHVYCDYIGLRFNQVVKIKFIQKLVVKLLERAEVVDCGERSVDSNRWVWDLLSKYKKAFIKILPKNLNRRKLK
ncbi:hypothetical protein EV200_10693 [Pedobacter psychrotolerans]|uniref:Uncharacterized protein n=1 Tax=Pedobacter psychrotolerans TaxID=1843235 RepID=A0A4R2H7M9_9SPHI|nr:hypothetical protein [Pedobacter psychrotolerans]TCO22453.1 hypothetical protein EV200_10693 [Pedobacter psychrotolerans]GGE64680.1 hypothetical protein GCM10011413_33910 [Pedobacter psychrotolerans]